MDSPLPGPGLTVIEASAGTGKTYELASLVVRYVAEGAPLSSILAVTFTRMATGELRDRIRRRLAEVRAHLAGLLDRDGTPVAAASDRPATDGADPLAQLLAADRSTAPAALDRIEYALADFDAATIATTHSFCQAVLHGLGTAGDSPLGSQLIEDPRGLVREVVADLYLRWSAARGPLPYTPETAGAVAEEALRYWDVPVFRYPPGGRAAALTEVAVAARDEIARRLLLEDGLTYDDLLARLARTLDDPERGPEAVRRLSQRYRIVLVDEFQDTDPVQWRILDKAFNGPGSPTRLVLIGDPKQAIYGFRCADVHSYLDAARRADTHRTLKENWRSDQPLLDAINAFFGKTAFGHQDIVFRAAEAPPGRQPASLPGRPIRVRVVDDNHPDIERTAKKNLLSKSSLTAWVASDAAEDIHRLLLSGSRLPDGSGGERPVSAGDVAVLTRTNRQATTVRDALRSLGIAAVVAGADSVFSSEAAPAWVRLLEALQEPTARQRLAALALSPFVGMTPHELASAPEQRWEDLYGRVLEWRSVLDDRGVAALYRTVADGEGLPARLLAVEGGERLLTDLAHLAEVLQDEAASRQLGAASLRLWLADRIRMVAEEARGPNERSRRLDSDAAAVQVLTVHGAKGLEFPVVYCPFLWDVGNGGSVTRPVAYHDPDSGSLMLDVGCPDRNDEPDSNTFRAHLALSEEDALGEDLRLMYVAFTRARHQVVIWWGRAQGCGASPLGRLLLCRDPDNGTVGRPKNREPSLRSVKEALDAIRERSGGTVALEYAVRRPPTLGSGTRRSTPSDVPLSIANFDRTLDGSWRRASYTGMTARTGRQPAVSSEPEESGISDEPDTPEAVAAVPPGAGTGPDRPSPWAPLPGGTAVGSFVHRVLEEMDFAASGGPAEARRAIDAVWRGAKPLVDPDRLAEAIDLALATPLGPSATDPPLRAIDRRDRLNELSFELPVAGGDSPHGSVTIDAIASAIAGRADPGGRLAGYPEQLRQLHGGAALRGYLVGSLDLVFRRTGEDGIERWYVADYKTNWLAPPGQDLMVGHYHPAAMDAEMRLHHYHLQALFYAVALHRFLRWRFPPYQPEMHLGGVYYLFLRGMAGPLTPVVGAERCGVYRCEVDPGLVLDLSDLFDRADGQPGSPSRPASRQ